MDVNKSALEERLTQKSTDELRAISDGGKDYTPEARDVAAAILAERAAHPEIVDTVAEGNDSTAKPRTSLVTKVLGVFAAVVVIRELLHLLSYLIFR